MKKLIMLCVAIIMALGLAKAQTYPENPVDVSPLLVGEVVEDIPIYDANGQAVSLYSMDKPVVMVFYRGLWCSNCIKHFTQEFKDHLQEIESLGYRLVLVSADQGKSLKAAAEQVGISESYFYGDRNNALAKKMGLVWQQQDRLKERLAESSDGSNVDALLPISAFYIIAPATHEIRFADLRPQAIPVAKRILYKEYMPVLKAYAEIGF